MSRLNIEIKEDLHEILREERRETDVPIKHLVNKALENEYKTSEESS